MSTEIIENPLYGKSYVQNDEQIAYRWTMMLIVFVCIPFVFSIPVLVKMAASGCGFYLLGFLGVFLFSVLMNAKLSFRIAKESGVLQRHFDKVNIKYKFHDGFKDSILATHIRNLKMIWKQSGQREISQESLIEILHAKLKSEGSLVLLFSNVMITLGLIGTISGLITSVAGLAMTSGENEFLGGLNVALGGVGEAFYTTLVGSVLGGISLRVLHFYVDKKIDQFILALAELVEIKIMPEFRLHQRKTDLRRVAVATLEALEEMDMIKNKEYDDESQSLSLSA